VCAAEVKALRETVARLEFASSNAQSECRRLLTEEIRESVRAEHTVIQGQLEHEVRVAREEKRSAQTKAEVAKAAELATLIAENARLRLQAAEAQRTANVQRNLAASDSEIASLREALKAVTEERDGHQNRAGGLHVELQAFSAAAVEDSEDLETVRRELARSVADHALTGEDAVQLENELEQLRESAGMELDRLHLNLEEALADGIASHQAALQGQRKLETMKQREKQVLETAIAQLTKEGKSAAAQELVRAVAECNRLSPASECVVLAKPSARTRGVQLKPVLAERPPPARNLLLNTLAKVCCVA